MKTVLVDYLVIDDLSQYCTGAGPCIWSPGWLITFDFAGVHVVIIENEITDWTELIVFPSLTDDPQVFRRVTLEQVTDVLSWLVTQLGRETLVVEGVCDE